MRSRVDRAAPGLSAVVCRWKGAVVISVTHACAARQATDGHDSNIACYNATSKHDTKTSLNLASHEAHDGQQEASERRENTGRVRGLVKARRRCRRRGKENKKQGRAWWHCRYNVTLCDNHTQGDGSCTPQTHPNLRKVRGLLYLLTHGANLTGWAREYLQTGSLLFIEY